MRPNLTPSEVPKPPVGVNNQRLMDLTAQQAQYGKPLLTEGQPVPKQYRMGIGARILGTAGNFLSGFGGSRREPTYVGPGATNQAYARDEATREANLANVNTQIGTQEKLDTTTNKTYEDAIKQAYEGQLGEAREKLGSAAEANAATRTQLEQTQAEKNAAIAERDRALAGKAETPKTPTNEVELVQAYQTETDPTKKAALKGAIDQLAALKAAGKDTSAADLAKIIQIQNQKATMIDRVNKEKETERDRRYKELDKNLQLKYSPEKMAAERQKVDNDLDAKYAPRIQQASDEADKLLGLTKKGSALQSQPTAPATPATRTNAPINKIGQPVRRVPLGNIPAKPQQAEPRVRVREKGTNKIGTLPQSQLKGALASGKYETL